VLPGTPRGPGIPNEQDLFRTADALLAKTVNVVHWQGAPTPYTAILDALGTFRDRAQARGFAVIIEFIPATGIPDISTASQLIDDIGPSGTGILLDTWHLVRSKGGLEQLDRATTSKIRGLQISDWHPDIEQQPYVPMSGRLLPGAGELPLADIVHRVLEAQPHVPVGVEILSDSMRALNTDGAAKAAADAVRSVLSP
jgi:sugar phosphate isomerase/epimerase